MSYKKQVQREQRVLATLIGKPELFKMESLDQDLFQGAQHKELFSIMKNSYIKYGKLDPLNIVDELCQYKLDNYYYSLMDQFIGIAFFYDDIEQLKETKCINEIKNLVINAEKEKINLLDLKSDIAKVGSEYLEVNDNHNLSEEEIYQLITTKDDILQFKQMKFIEDKLKIKQHTVIAVSARTGKGKSTFALNIMEDLSRSYRCIYLNMEMTEKEVYQRLVSMDSKVPSEYFPTLEENLPLRDKVSDGIYTLVNNRNFRIYNGSKSLDSIRKLIMKESRNGHCIVFVDYVGYVTYGRNLSDRERITHITKELQLITKDYNCTIFLLAQINREGSETPKIENIKDSGEIEQTADTIMILNDESKDLNDDNPIYSILVPKSRSGKVGKISVVFNKKIQRFEEVGRY